jgi:hypothetical protein
MGLGLSTLKALIKSCNEVLSILDKLEENRPLNPPERQFRNILKKHISRLLKNQKDYWKIRYTIRWTKLMASASSPPRASSPMQAPPLSIPSPVLTPIPTATTVEPVLVLTQSPTATATLLRTELSLSSRGRMTLGVGEIFLFISHTLPQCHALQGVGDTYL